MADADDVAVVEVVKDAEGVTVREAVEVLLGVRLDVDEVDRDAVAVLEAVLVDANRRMRSLPMSAMNTLPLPSTATPYGLSKLALVPGPPSPLKLPLNKPTPFPATVVITPVPAASRRTR